jgi:Fic family protein
MPDETSRRIAELKRALDALRPLSGPALAQLQKHFDVELTFTSNAIEGNTLYSMLPRRVAGSPAIFPNPAKIPDLMAALGGWLETAEPSPALAFDAHFRLTAIHPFGDGNGRTARLLMNLVLLRAGYPPVAIRPEDRAGYLAALETGSTTDDLTAFRALMSRRLAETMAAYVAALEESAG